MKYGLISASLAMVLGGAPLAAQAQSYAYTAGVVNLRAGPASVYPIVNVLPAGLQVTVFGCLSDYTWCDISTGPERGWVYARYLNYPYQSGYAPLATVGAVVGIAALVFILDDYWHDHYRHRSWYPQRQRWERYGPRYAHPAPPPNYRARPPQHVPPPGGVRPPRHDVRPYGDRRGEPPGQARRHDDGGPPGQRGRDGGAPGRGRDNGPPGHRGRD